jgi:hypothetical protein
MKAKEGPGLPFPALLITSLPPLSGADHPISVEIDRLHAVGVYGEVRVFLEERLRPVGTILSMISLDCCLIMELCMDTLECALEPSASDTS